MGVNMVTGSDGAKVTCVISLVVSEMAMPFFAVVPVQLPTECSVPTPSGGVTGYGRGTVTTTSTRRTTAAPPVADIEPEIVQDAITVTG